VSAFEYRRVQLICDQRRCYQFFQGEEGIPPSSGESRAAVRRRAAKAGWTHVRSNWGRRADHDYCPDHKPAEAAQSAGTENKR
jgi:hypothetical protein